VLPALGALKVADVMALSRAAVLRSICAAFAKLLLGRFLDTFSWWTLPLVALARKAAPGSGVY
jgi:hypothetical protein